jgi:D-arabinose 1-dehydrogenase-like Zn-dependent alcohol dehydrogenase
MASRACGPLKNIEFAINASNPKTIDDAYAQVVDSDIRYRVVIDAGTI